MATLLKEYHQAATGELRAVEDLSDILSSLLYQAMKLRERGASASTPVAFVSKERNAILLA